MSRLWSKCGMRLLERNPVSSDTENGHPSGRITADLPHKTTPTVDQLTWGELVRLGSGTSNDVSKTISQLEQLPVFRGGQQAVREPGRRQGDPETVSRPGEVVANSGGVETWVYATEEDLEIPRHNVGEASASGGEQFGLGGALSAHWLG